MVGLRGTLWRWVLLPVLLVAAAFLAWWTWRTTRELEESGERSIIDSTVLLTRNTVDRVERDIITDDNAVMALVNPDDLEVLATRFPIDRNTPLVRSVLVLDEGQRVLRHVSRDDDATAARFRDLFVRRVLPELHLEDEAPLSHRHLHEVVDGRSVMVSYLTREVPGTTRRYYVVLEADLDYIRGTLLPGLFDDPGARGQFNVTDEDGRLIYGKPLRGAGDFVVSRQFPTTLYKWRLQLAPRSAPELLARARNRRLLDALLVAISVTVLVAGVAFLAYAARNEQRLNQLKSDFIATVSHELKTPLSLIRMFGEMLSTGRVPSDTKRREYLEIIVRESERLTGLIDNVLDFAKLERGKAAYEFARGNLGDVVVRGVELFRYRLDRERPRVVVDVAREVPDSDLDERSIQLLLFNLLDNALKYAATSDFITVRVRSGGSRAVLLEVQDEGPGIAPEDAKRIFERFYRGRAAGSGGARGSGIGLALVKHIAEAHGGSVRVHAAPVRGAVFEVRLPVRLARELDPG